jgi:thiosulfate dehydrogenase [quinone] large subunit
VQDYIEVNECAGCTCGKAKPDNTIDRRQFLTMSAYVAAAAALAACAGGGTDATSPTSVSTTVNVSDFPALATVGGVATTNVNGTPIAIVRTGATTFITLSRVCPHQGSTVNATSTGFRCPNHGATFDKNGTWTGGQRTSSMKSYPTVYDAASGMLTIG